MTQVIYTKYIWSGLLLVAIYWRQERETAITAPPAQSGWRVLMMLSALWLVRQWPGLASDWPQGSHRPRTIWPWQSPFPGQDDSHPGPESWAETQTGSGKGFAQCTTPSKLQYATHRRGNHFGQICDTFSRRHRKYDISLRVCENKNVALIISFYCFTRRGVMWSD